MLSWRAFPSVPALRSTNSAADPSALFVGFPATMAWWLGQFIGQLATVGHYSLSRCGELLNVLLGHFPLLPLHHLPLEG